MPRRPTPQPPQRARARRASRLTPTPESIRLIDRAARTLVTLNAVLKLVLQRDPVGPILLLFVLISLLFPINGVNTYSRFATMAAMRESHSFQIDSAVVPVEHTHDWARTPDGHYYSNKAPGPMFLGFPLFWCIDQIVTRGARARVERDALRWQYADIELDLLSLLLQVLPFGLLALALSAEFERRGLSRGARTRLGLALLLGNTSVFFMGSYYGHGMAACFALGAALAILRGRNGWTGFLLGWAVLCDYGAVFFLPGAFFALGWVLRDRKGVRNLALGALLPAVLWCWYHTVAFGSPFTLPNAYQNPRFVDLAHQSLNLWGVYTPIPNPWVLLKLLFGDHRGLIKTQPWVLVWLAWFALKGRGAVAGLAAKERAVTWFAILGFAGILFMNAGFGAWEGGASPGPRYLSPIFPTLVLAIALSYRELSAGWAKAFAVALVPAVFYVPYFFMVKGFYPLFIREIWGKGIPCLSPGLLMGTFFVFAYGVLILKLQYSSLSPK